MSRISNHQQLAAATGVLAVVALAASIIGDRPGAYAQRQQPGPSVGIERGPSSMDRAPTEAHARLIARPEAPAGAIEDRSARVATALRNEAERLHDVRQRWPDAATLHLHAAVAHDFRDEAALRDLLLAGSLLYRQGDVGAAILVMEKAVDTALRTRNLHKAWFAYQNATALAQQEGRSHAGDWDELVRSRVVPAPSARVTLEAPAVRWSEDDVIEARLRAPELGRPTPPTLPAVRSVWVTIPAPRHAFAIHPPTVQVTRGEDLDDAGLRVPVLRRPPAPGLPPIRSPDGVEAIPSAPRLDLQIAPPSLKSSVDTEGIRLSPELEPPAPPGLPAIEDPSV